MGAPITAFGDHLAMPGTTHKWAMSATIQTTGKRAPRSIALREMSGASPLMTLWYNPTGGGDICTRTQTLLALPELKHSLGFQQMR